MIHTTHNAPSCSPCPISGTENLHSPSLCCQKMMAYWPKGDQDGLEQQSVWLAGVFWSASALPQHDAAACCWKLESKAARITVFTFDLFLSNPNPIIDWRIIDRLIDWFIHSWARTSVLLIRVFLACFLLFFVCFRLSSIHNCNRRKVSLQHWQTKST